jgi:hypothetical protein
LRRLLLLHLLLLLLLPVLPRVWRLAGLCCAVQLLCQICSLGSSACLQLLLCELLLGEGRELQEVQQLRQVLVALWGAVADPV